VQRFDEATIYEAAERVCADLVGMPNSVNKSTLKYRFLVSCRWPVLSDITNQ
jgi:hypothetical protein